MKSVPMKTETGDMTMKNGIDKNAVMSEASVMMLGVSGVF